MLSFFFFLLGKFAILGVHFVDSPFFLFSAGEQLASGADGIISLSPLVSPLP